MTTRGTEFPPLERIARWAGAEPDDAFVRMEFGPGLPYYRRRLEQILFEGRAVLDAGCGMGQWSAALAGRFDRVVALDPNPDRLRVARRVAGELAIDNLDCVCGRIESLPLPDRSFDAVFCYGVVMFADLELALAEFHRVLEPGGRVYLCLNGDGFSLKLLRERREAAARRAGAETLYNTFWRRAREAELFADLGAWRSRLAGGFRARLWRQLAGPGPLSRAILEGTPAGRALLEQVERQLPPAYQARLLADVEAILVGAEAPREETRAQNYLPEELAPRVAAAGFTLFQWAPEGGLLFDWVERPCPPKYPGGFFEGKVSVWEAVFHREGGLRIPIRAARHLELAARAAGGSPLVAGVPAPAVSNRWFAPELAAEGERARRTARALGGDRYLHRLASSLVEEATDEEDAARRLIRFVQGALYRDPVVQPLEADGRLPDPLVTLCWGRGRCGHAADLVVALARAVGLEARIWQLPRHVTAEIRVGGRFVLAEADAFKAGVLPEGENGGLPGREEILASPRMLDRLPPNGWIALPGSRATRDALGVPVAGYVDALPPEQRGFLSAYFSHEVEDAPPSIPWITEARRIGPRIRLSWRPSRLRRGRLVGYRVAVGSGSRGWDWATVLPGADVRAETPSDVAHLETRSTTVEVEIGDEEAAVYASVTPRSDRVELEPETWFWPSDEVRLEP